MALRSSLTIPPISLKFRVRRLEPELILPAKPIPQEIKYLSDIDDQLGLRFQVPLIFFYPYAYQPEDPATMIRRALAKTLVYYYPFAGRLKEIHGKKLVVDCTGKLGVIFIEADADVELKDFGDTPHPPIPCLEELLFDVPGSSDILNTPLLLFQVTRLRCGGFILAIRLNHVMTDAAGFFQFMTALGELIQGKSTPSIMPAWERHLLCARSPPSVSFDHREYDHVLDMKSMTIPVGDMAHRSFFFGSAEITALRRLVPPDLYHSTALEILTSSIWRARAIALSPNPDEEMRFISAVNARAKFSPPLPSGYYGNLFAIPVAIAGAGDLTSKPLGFAVELVKAAKGQVTEEYMKSAADLMVIRGRPLFSVAGLYLVSDNTHAGLDEVDLGWGKPRYGGVAQGTISIAPTMSSFLIPVRKKGEKGIMVSLNLPTLAMEKFVMELEGMVYGKNKHDEIDAQSKPIRSML